MVIKRLKSLKFVKSRTIERNVGIAANRSNYKWELHKNCLYLVFFWSMFSRIRTDTEYRFVFSPNAQKYGPDKLQIQTFFTQWGTIIKLRRWEISLTRLLEQTLWSQEKMFEHNPVITKNNVLLFLRYSTHKY